MEQDVLRLVHESIQTFIEADKLEVVMKIAAMCFWKIPFRGFQIIMNVTGNDLQ